MAASRRKMQAHQARQRRIRPEFQALTAELTTEFLGYLRHFDRIEALLAAQGHNERTALQEAVRAQEAPDFFAAFDAGLARLSDCVASYTRDEHHRHAFYFRNQMWPFIAEVPVMRRCVVQPRGYPGDSGVMQMMYDARYEGHSMLAQLMHWHAIQLPAAQAVRNRRQLVADHAARIADAVAPVAVRVLSVACGPAAELQHLLAPSATARSYELTLVDQDPRALQEAQSSLALARAAQACQVQASLLQLSALDLAEDAQAAKDLTAFHFIYSMGLFDYLPTSFAKKLATNLFARLQPGGTLLLGNYHVSNPHRVYMQYWSDWTLTYRTEEEMLALFSDVAPAQIEVGFEPSNTQMFVRVRKSTGS